ncbi:ParM/StbA family protein [Caldifermentibacillus hisashii]|uniref:ParM/StbA family protein n=1 Tax=Caldifermentibacillus hisashii TaxID=996558 RepID=UPI002E1D3F0D|nr:ParM/StbA family protein [Caldifermentibacillus hisashii]
MEFHFVVANDNGNSEHKIMINGILHKQPNVYSIIHSDQGQSDEPLDVLIANIHKNIDVRIESKVLSGTYRYLIGHAAIERNQAQIYNMNIQNIKKHTEDLPVINTLGTIAVEAVKKAYDEKKTLTNGEVIKVTADMTTALPASIHNVESEEYFKNRFLNHLHEVKVYIKDLTIIVQIEFSFVKVMKEGVPALFSLIEDGNNNYRNDDIFEDFNKEYKNNVDGSYFLNKRILHCDIGDGSTELVYTTGYSADPLKSAGEKIGLGQAIENAGVNLSKELNLDISRQKISEYLKNPNHKFHQLALKHIYQPKQEIARKIFNAIENRLQTLAFEVDVLMVYGGASILLKDVLYDTLKNYCDKYGIELLWIPSKYAVEMNVNGMQIYNTIRMADLQMSNEG